MPSEEAAKKAAGGVKCRSCKQLIVYPLGSPHCRQCGEPLRTWGCVGCKKLVLMADSQCPGCGAKRGVSKGEVCKVLMVITALCAIYFDYWIAMLFLLEVPAFLIFRER